MPRNGDGALDRTGHGSIHVLAAVDRQR
jgi:hypothetical protein